MFSRASTLAVLAAALLHCSGGDRDRGPLPPGPRRPDRNLDLLESFADRVEKESLDASWRRALGDAGPARRFGRRPLQDLRPAEIEALRAALEGDETANRRLDAVTRLSLLLRHDAAPGVAPARARLDAARSRLRLDDPARHRVLLESADEGERRRAWLDLHAGAEQLAPLVVELTRARRAWARSEGHDSAWDALASVDGVSEWTRERLLAQVESALRPRRGAELEDPWNLESSHPVLAKRLALALPADAVVERSLSVARRLGAEPSRLRAGPDAVGFSAHATWAVDPPQDVRVLLSPEAGIAGAWRALHEFGHAAQARLAPPQASPMLQRSRSPAVAEGAAKLLERLAWSAEWGRGLGLSEDELSGLAAWEAASERARARRILADTAFERALHESPGAALDALHRQAWAERGLRAPQQLPAWAAERSISHAPGERLAYLLARCVQAATWRRLRAMPGGLLGEASFRVLREEVLPAAAGASYEEWFVAAAGEAPSCTAWIEDVARIE